MIYVKAARPGTRENYHVVLSGLSGSWCDDHPHDIRGAQLAPVSGVSVGARLLSAARDADADLLVIGGYGKAPWREMPLGGATRHVVATSLLPILISH